MENGVTRKTSRPARILIIEPAITNNVACHGHFIRVEYLRNFVRRRIYSYLHVSRHGVSRDSCHSPLFTNVNNGSRTSIATSLAEIIFDETTDSIVLICVAGRDCYFVFRRKLDWIILIAIIGTIEYSNLF